MIGPPGEEKKINGRSKNFRKWRRNNQNVEQAYVDADVGGTESKRHIAHIGFIAPKPGAEQR